MTSRIGTYGASQQYLGSILSLQSQTNAAELQVSSGKISPTYDGIAQAADSVLNYQVTNAENQQYQTDNDVTTTKLQAASAAVDGMQTSLENFTNELQSFQQNDTFTASSVNQIQTFAFQTLQDMQAYLGSNISGEYLFSGGKSTTVPMQMSAATLNEFQSQYNGSTITYPTTSGGDLLNLNLTSKQTTALSFQPASGTITAAQANALSDVAAGSTITVGGSNANNNTYTVHSQASTNITGAALAETTPGTGAGTTALVSYGPNATSLTNTTTGNLNFAFNASGQMTVTPTNANTLSALTTGTRFTISGSTGNAWDGSYQVVSNINGAVTLQNDETPVQPEQVSSSTIGLTDNTSGTSPTLTAGPLNFTSSSDPTSGLTTVTLTAAGPTDFAGITPGDYVTVNGTDNHNGTFQVAAASGNSISFVANPDAVRVSQFLPQTGRTDVNVSATDPQGNQTSFTNLDYGSMSFSPTGSGGETMTAATPGSFVNPNGAIAPPPGSIMKLSSTSGVNDGTYTVVSNDGTNIVVQSNTLSTETNSTTATISSTSYYQGDSLQQSQITDQGRAVAVGTTAADPAFEKAIRALGIIAQGTYGTAGGLDQNQSRVSAALWLINDSLSSPAAGTPPYGQEASSDLNSVSQGLGYTQSIITQQNTTDTQVNGFLQKQISSQENADQTTAVTSLLNDSNALQAAYQALAQIRSLSLMTYLK